MSVENLLWGAPRIHGELLKLGFAVAQSTVAKYMGRRGDPFGQSWGTFLRNHAPRIAAMDLFVVPTIGFNLSPVVDVMFRAEGCLTCNFLDNDLPFLDSHLWIRVLGKESERLGQRSYRLTTDWT